MKYIKKKIFFLNIQKILEKNTFVLFFQYTHLKSKEWTFFKKILGDKIKSIKKNSIHTTKLNTKKCNFLFMQNKKMYICNNKILNNILEKEKNTNLPFFSKNLQKCYENLYLSKHNKPNTIFNNFIFCAQGPTVCIFFNSQHLLNIFFSEISFFCGNINEKKEKSMYTEMCIHKNKQKKNFIFIEKKNYTMQISQNLFFIGGIYKKSFVNIHTLQNICVLNTNVYNYFILIYFMHMHTFLNNVKHIQYKYIYFFYLIFYTFILYLFVCKYKNKYIV